MLNFCKEKPVAIWGTGREGLAAAAFIQQKAPELALWFLDEKDGPSTLSLDREYPVLREADAIAAMLSNVDLVVKSPGVSLYHPLLENEKKRGLVVTSLLSLWAEEAIDVPLLCVTGTKGKSTISSLLGHVLGELGKKVEVVGNIGVPVTTASSADLDYYVVEVSSYQAADFASSCHIGIVASLFPEHLDWHGSLRNYYRDKANLLARSKTKLISASAQRQLAAHSLTAGDGAVLFGDQSGWHSRSGLVHNGAALIGCVENDFLSRRHNDDNVASVMATIDILGLDAGAALRAMSSYKSLPHRQEMLGVSGGLLFVDDSISTTPQSSIAALDIFVGRPLGLIAGGYDRGIDYTLLIDYLANRPNISVFCLGQSGARLYAGLRAQGKASVFLATTMEEAVLLARQTTPKGGVVLLSPAAPSYDMFLDYRDRAAHFKRASGLAASG